MANKTPQISTKADPLSDLAKTRGELIAPGYWETLGGNCDQWASEFNVCPFWRAAGDHLTRWRQEYKDRFSAELLSSPNLPDFVAKSVGSIKDKIGRKLQSKTPHAEIIPMGGAPIPILGDLVRTRVVCKYIDGVEFLATKLCDLANSMSINTQRERQGRVEGYFAQHINFENEVFYRVSGFPTPARVRCEIQLATDFGTRMWDATHSLYESDRNTERDPSAWQWTPADPRFIANQLGHMMHLADGLLVQLREHTSSEKKA